MTHPGPPPYGPYGPYAPQGPYGPAPHVQVPYRQAPPAHARQAPPPAVAICRHCGIVAPQQGTTCESCGRPLVETRIQVRSQSDETYWVALRCAFTCNSCRFLAPLDGLDADGAVECAQCGLRQRFDVESWREGLALAHAVGDLAGPGPEGRAPHPSLWIGTENPHASIGVDKTFARIRGVGETQLVVEASPGHPVCRKCRVPLTLTVDRPGAATATCSHCGDRATYALSDAARGLHPGLVAAVADDHRTDRPRAKTTTTEAGAVALRCPGCGAPLSLEGKDRVQTCAFCKVTCIVPTRVISQARHDVPEPAIWWVLFAGPSPKRRALESPPAEEPKAALKDAAKMLAFMRKKHVVGEEPGVYEAPEAPGTDWPQWALTVALGAVALAVGWLTLGN